MYVVKGRLNKGVRRELGGGGGGGVFGGMRRMSLMILVAFLFVSPGRRLKGERVCGQSVLITTHGTNARTNQTLIHQEAGHAAHGH